MKKELLLQRTYDNGDTTIGVLYDLNPFLLLGFTCEDQHQAVKIMKETRIPAGRYRLVINKVVTGKTNDYRARYPWFKYHIMLENVKGFSGIYIHIGNRDDDTEGCLLVGDTQVNIAIPKYKAIVNGKSANAIGESTISFQRFYEEYYPLIEEVTNEVYLTVKDELH